ncbi:MAG: HTH domain-containing protein [Thermoplasmatota archaeon]
MSQDDMLEQFGAVPASVQKVMVQLESNSPMTGKQLREATGLPRRTIYSALKRLRELGILKEQYNLRDTRQRFLWLDTEKIEAGTASN